jgi:DNA-binding HxlR family transcriptional regulator
VQGVAAPPAKRHPYAQWSPDARALDLVGDKWTLLIVRDLMGGPRRFVELQRVLPGISTEQLRSRLNRMVADDLLTRQRYREVPPRVDYELTERARALAPVLGALAQWGFDWAWDAPRKDERLDVGALLRLCPGLLSPPRSLRGTVLCKVDDRAYLLTVRAGEVTLADPAPADATADATVAGDAEAWVRSLLPDGDSTGLHVEGRRDLADALLDELFEAAGRIEQQAA